MVDTPYKCPECGSDEVTSTAEQKIMVNTGAHYVHSVKPWFNEAKSDCLACGWEGYFKDLCKDE